MGLEDGLGENRVPPEQDVGQKPESCVGHDCGPEEDEDDEHPLREPVLVGLSHGLSLQSRKRIGVIQISITRTVAALSDIEFIHLFVVRGFSRLSCVCSVCQP